MKRILTIGLAFIMMASVCAMIVPIEAEAGDNIDTLEIYPLGITPSDLAWNPSGSVALMVGNDGNVDGRNAALYDPELDTWTELVTFPPNFVGYTLTSVEWAEGLFGTGGWVISGNARGPGFISAYYVMYGSDTMNELPGTGTPPIDIPLNDIASDEYGNAIVVGSATIDRAYFYNNNDQQWYYIANQDDSGFFYGVDYDTNNHRYYLVGTDTGNGALIQYTDPIVGATSFPDFHWVYAGVVFTGYFKDIHWNNDPALAPSDNFAVLYGSANNYLYSITPIENGVFIEESTDTPNIVYVDMAWNEDTWEEATFIGQNGTLCEIYQYNMESDGTVLLYQSGAAETAYCVDYKPPSSPGWGMVLSSGGASKIKITEFDISTRLTANAVFPKLYWIGFNDSAGVSRLDQQVPVDSWYNFTCGFNYSEGWAGCEVEVWAWYDWGAVGAGSDYPAETDDNRDLAFRLLYDMATSVYTLESPGPSPGTMEVAIDDTWDTDVIGWVHPTNPGIEDIHELTIPIYLGPQIRYANGNSFGSADDPDANGETDKNLGLQDTWSWDFEVEVRDILNPTAFANRSAEFGIDETVSISVTGNPSGNTPPGTTNNSLTIPSLITYSANTDYWVNVSIPHLLENGVGPAQIDCTWVTVANVNSIVNDQFSDLNWPGGRAIVGPNVEWCVWGNSSILAPTNMPAPQNGTISFGEFGSDFNQYDGNVFATTQLDWWISVPAGTAEGVYWAVITITVDS